MTELGHLLVADEVFSTLGWTQELCPPFYLGAIAPDAHRVTVGVDYRGLHFRSSRTAGRRFIDFLRNHLRPALASSDAFAQAFYSGWLTHICADHIWRQHLRHELSQVWGRIVDGATLESAAMRDEFYEECDWADQRLYEQNNQRVENIRWMLQHSSLAYTVPPLKPQDIGRWRQQVLMEMMPPSPPDIERPQLISLEFVTRSMSDAVRECLAIFALEVERVTGKHEAPPAQEPDEN